MKRTLIDIVREILSEMDSDDVNALGDTVESIQVASIVRSCYFEIIANRNWPHLRKLLQLEHSGDPNRPTHLKVPENIKELVFFKYNKFKGNSTVTSLFGDVTYKYPDEFLRLVSGRSFNSAHTIQIADFSGTSLLILDNVAPTYWTSFDDSYIVCDSYDKAVDDTLQKHKTQALMYIHPTWIHTEDAIPDLPAEAFPALVEEAKSTAFLTLKQMANDKAEQKARRQERWLARKAWQTHGGVRYDNYGRKSNK